MTAAKIELIDKLANDVPSANVYLMNAIRDITQKRQVSVSEFLVAPKHAESLKQLVNETGINLQ